MAGKKGGGENSKKAAGLARKADAAEKKAAGEQAKRAAVEDADWQKGEKSNAKREAAAAKKAELAAKKAEREAALAEEERNTPGRDRPKNNKTAQKKTRGLDLAQLEDNGPLSALNATGIDNALDALSITAKSDSKIDRHPERRYPAALKKYMETRLPEMQKQERGLRRNQMEEAIRKEFDKSPLNPFNQVTASFNTSKEEMAEIRQQEKTKIEGRLGSK